MTDQKIHYKETEFGFEFGAAKVERFFSDKRTGAVTIGITTPRRQLGGEIQIYVTRTGKVRIFSRGEWTSPKKQP